ncbi:MAG: fimbrillin family protein, partial [Bacteroidaceae bacterium]|nr:fimbrillin family protein [Bacteroidaceae bacterium]
KLPASTPYTAVPIDMTGQDGTLETIGKKYDYMYAPSSFVETTLSDGTPFEVVFDFNHAISIIQLNLTMPVDATWKSIAITNDAGDKVWTTNATMNVSDGTITSTATSASINLALDNVVTTEDNKTLTLYVAALPTVIETLKLTATSSGDSKYVATLEGKRLQAGKAYRYTASLVVAPSTGVENGHEWIDLGLPSDLKWATMNIGASSPEGYGNYYAWGETEPQSSNTYSWSSYKWSVDGSSSTFSKYTTSTKTTLDSDDDAATVNWGGKWRMPTHTEQTELVTNCYWVWTSNYNDSGKAGYIIYKAKSSSDKGQFVESGNTPSSSYSLSDSHIFLPAAGSRVDGSLYYGFGVYWSSSLYESGSFIAWILYFDSFNRNDAYNSRFAGYSVRAVCEK